jgi:hypothetical protein
MKVGDRVQLKWGNGHGIIVEVTSSGGALPQPIVGVIVLWDGGTLGRIPSNLIVVVS